MTETTNQEDVIEAQLTKLGVPEKDWHICKHFYHSMCPEHFEYIDGLWETVKRQREEIEARDERITELEEEWQRHLAMLSCPGTSEETK